MGSLLPLPLPLPSADVLAESYPVIVWGRLPLLLIIRFIAGLTTQLVRLRILDFTTTHC